jgi:predicted nuclease with TOPRIM domain
MISKINARIEELSKEAEALVNRRSELEAELEESNVRLSQIVGAIQELDSMRKEISNGYQEGK